MKFLKEYFIIIIILVIIFFIENITSRKLGEDVGWMKNEIVGIENKIDEEKINEANEKFEYMKKEWEKNTEILALFVEHNELEKIDKDIVIIAANFKEEKSDDLIENISDLKFMLEHIEEKNKLKLKNIF